MYRVSRVQLISYCSTTLYSVHYTPIMMGNSPINDTQPLNCSPEGIQFVQVVCSRRFSNSNEFVFVGKTIPCQKCRRHLPSLARTRCYGVAASMKRQECESTIKCQLFGGPNFRCAVNNNSWLDKSVANGNYQVFRIKVSSAF